MKPKIRLFSFFLHPHQYGKIVSGSERRFLEISRHFKDLGLEVYVLEPEPSLKKTWMVADYKSLTVSMGPPKGILKKLLILLSLCFIGFRLCKKLRCNLLYVTRHELPENVIPGYFVSRFLRKPLVINFNGFFTKDRLPLSSVLSIRIRKKGFNPVSAILHTAIDLLMRFVFRKADACIAVSPTVKNEAIQYFGVRNITVSGNGVNLDKYQLIDVREKVYEAAFLGRIHPSKGIDILLRAWRIVADEAPQAKLVIIGGGLKEYLEFYDNMTKMLKLQDNVTITGFISDKDVMRFLNLSKIFFFPSKEEGFGIAVAEAMASGLPCVISDIPALKRIFGEVAILIHPNDAEGFARAIINLLIDRKKCEDLGLRSREYVKKFDWKEIAKKEVEVFKSLVT